MSFVAIACFAPFARAAPAPAVPETSVRISLPADLPLPEAHLLIYKLPADGAAAPDDWPTVQKDLERKRKESKLITSLPDGVYVAEIGMSGKDAIALLRSKPFKVPDVREIALTAERRTCDASIQNVKRTQLRQVALRRLGNGEVRWNSETPGASVPIVVTSPHENYLASAVATGGDTTLAIWNARGELSPKTIHFTDEAATKHLTFGFLPGTASIARSRVRVCFPDAEVKIDSPGEKTRFATNRGDALIAYQYETAAREQFVFHWLDCVIGADTHVELGGPLKATLFANQVWEETGNGWKPHFRTQLDFADATGRLLDLGQSKFGLEQRLFSVNGEERYPIVDPEKVDLNGFAPEKVMLSMRYSYDGRQKVEELKGEGGIAFHSEHFKISGPSAWTFRAKEYLKMLEAIRVLTQHNTGRPGPASFRADFRYNGNNAKSIVGSAEGGAQDIWQSYPFWGFESFWDPFDEPWFGDHDPYVCHETLHTFGYNHGDEMSHLEWRGEDQYRTFRWRSVDTGTSPVWGAADIR